MASGKIGSHNAQAIPDKKMGRADWRTSTISQTAKRQAAKKRRQRDRREERG